ncbi:MAG: flavodoxin [Tissierellia bacterium]|nr:flavodoxin [Tissierellia bacterium]
MSKIKNNLDSIKNYETIFVGTPTWTSTISPPIRAFITMVDRKDKTIIPFGTNKGRAFGKGLKIFEELCKGGNVLKGYSKNLRIKKKRCLNVYNN